MGTEHRSFVILRRDAPPPPICFKCGTREGISLALTHFYTTPDENAATEAASAAGMLVSAIGDAATVASFVQLIRGIREAEVSIPLCASCAARWKTAKRVRLLAFVPMVVAFVAIMVFAFAAHGPLFPPGGSRITLYAFVGVTTGVLYTLAAVVPKLVERRVAEPLTCGAVAIAPAWIALSRVHPAACVALIQAAPREARMMLQS